MVAPKGYKYCCFEEFVIENGRLWTAQALPSKYRPMAVKACYYNAYTMLKRRKSNKLIYCEGYATNYITTMHAWLIDENGLVVDPTWENAATAEYYGVPFSRDFVIETVERRNKGVRSEDRIYGVIEDWKTNHPLMKGLPKEKFMDSRFI